MTPNISTIVRDQVSLEVRRLDRLYLQAFIPKLQTSGGGCFHRDYLGHAIPSPALLQPRHDAFVAAVNRYAAERGEPLIHFDPRDREDDVIAPYRHVFPAREGGVVIGVAEEKAPLPKTAERRLPSRGVTLDFLRQCVHVKHCYFHVQDRDWGSRFLKVCTYLPYPVKLSLSGHEWVKQQPLRRRVHYDSLENGFRACADPAALQAFCDQVGPAQVHAFFGRWSHRLPWPMSPAERAAGSDHRLSLCQVEVSLTQVFDRSVQGRLFFEAVIRDNVDLGRPDRVGLLFLLKVAKATQPPASGCRTRVITGRVEPSLHVEYKSPHAKHNSGEQHALRTETTIDDPTDFYVPKAVGQLSFQRDLGQTANRKLLEAERVSHPGVLTQDALDRLQQPTVVDTQRAPALWFGDARVTALCQALTTLAHQAHGFRNRDLRRRVAALLAAPDSAAQMPYDLRRLRLRGLFNRLPGTHRYTATTYGLEVVLLHSELHLRVLRPQWPTLTDPDHEVPRSLRTVLDQPDAGVRELHEEAALAA